MLIVCSQTAGERHDKKGEKYDEDNNNNNSNNDDEDGKSDNDDAEDTAAVADDGDYALREQQGELLPEHGHGGVHREGKLQ